MICHVTYLEFYWEKLIWHVDFHVKMEAHAEKAFIFGKNILFI